VRVRFARVEFQFLHLVTAEARLVDHAPNSLTKDFFRIASKHVFRGRGLQAADVASVLAIEFVVPLVTGENDFVSVDDDDEVTCIRMTGVRRLVFADDHFRQNRREAADHLVLRIDDIPLRRIRAFRLKEMRSHLLRLIRFLLQNNNLRAQRPHL
jgi:hypothetical protein